MTAIRLAAALRADLFWQPLHDLTAALAARLDAWLCDYGTDDQGDL